MNPTLCITRWNETFENSDTRKRERLKFFHAPSGCDSNGYLELMTCHQSAGVLAFGVFQALCQLAATMPAKQRGRFVKSNGSAMSLTQIALLIRVESATLADAIELLSDQSVGWLKWEQEKAQSADNLPGSCQPKPSQPADEIPPTAGFVQGQGQGKGKGQGKGEREERAPARKAPEPIPTIPEDDWGDEMPIETARDFTQLQARINALHPSWRKRPHFTRAEQDELLANSRIFFDISDDDWRLLEAYIAAAVDPEWKLKVWQPDNRSMFLKSVTDVLTHADNWQRECKRRKVATGLERGAA